MTDEQQTEQKEQVAEDPIAKLRDEFQSQFTALKTSFETENKKNLETIEKLSKENEELHRALVRSAQIPPTETEPAKTEEEIYAETIVELAKKSREIERRNRGIFDDKH